MVRHPDVFAKAQAEVDAVVGHSRLPDFGDRPSMPYIEAMLSECLRYSTPAPLSTSLPSNNAQQWALIAFVTQTFPTG